MYDREQYEDLRCPRCGAVMVDGRCENRQCDYHWRPMEPDEHPEDDDQPDG